MIIRTSYKTKGNDERSLKYMSKYYIKFVLYYIKYYILLFPT